MGDRLAGFWGAGLALTVIGTLVLRQSVDSVDPSWGPLMLGWALTALGGMSTLAGFIMLAVWAAIAPARPTVGRAMLERTQRATRHR